MHDSQTVAGQLGHTMCASQKRGKSLLQMQHSPISIPRSAVQVNSIGTCGGGEGGGEGNEFSSFIWGWDSLKLSIHRVDTYFGQRVASCVPTW